MDKHLSVIGDPLIGSRPAPAHTPAPRPAVDVERLFVEHQRRLTNLAAAITLDRSVAEEVVQDAFADAPPPATWCRSRR